MFWRRGWRGGVDVLFSFPPFFFERERRECVEKAVLICMHHGCGRRILLLACMLRYGCKTLHAEYPVSI